jgi:uncharacterized protein
MNSHPGNSSGSVLDPVREQQRIFSIDVLRGVALLGILLMNIVGMALPDPAYWDPSGYGGDTGWNLRVFFACNLLIEGTMRSIFSMLFGAGVILFTARKETEGAGLELANAWYRRTIWLIIFGLIHAYILVWPGEILYAYGIVGMFLFPVRHASARKLIGFSLFVFLVIAFLNVHEAWKARELHGQALVALELREAGDSLTFKQQEDLDGWNSLVEEYKPSAESKERTVKDMRSGYIAAVKAMAPLTQWLQTGWFFRHGFMDVLSMMLLGMGLLKLGIFQGDRSWRVYAMFVLIGYGVGIPVNWHETTTYIAGDFSVLAYYKTQQTYDLGRIFTTMGHVGLVMLFMKIPFLGLLKRSLAAVGRMALTNYILHTVIATITFVIFRQFGQWERYQLYFLVLGIWIFQMVVSPVWLHYFRFGPLEWLWRWLTYGRKPVFRKQRG